jgi:hypothetical protein
VTDDEFDALFEGFQHTAFRYEGRPRYAVGGQEAEQLAAWRRGEPRAERSVRTSDWLRRIAVTTAAGKQWCRVRVVDQPVPEYLRFELAGLVENQVAGDQTLMIEREYAVDGPDFWLFDGGTELAQAVLLLYTDEGEFDDLQLVTESAALAELEQARQHLLAQAVPLNVWLAQAEHADA